MFCSCCQQLKVYPTLIDRRSKWRWVSLWESKNTVCFGTSCSRKSRIPRWGILSSWHRVAPGYIFNESRRSRWCSQSLHSPQVLGDKLFIFCSGRHLIFFLYWFKLVLHPGSVKLNCAGNSCDGQMKARGQALIEGELDFLWCFRYHWILFI